MTARFTMLWTTLKEGRRKERIQLYRKRYFVLTFVIKSNNSQTKPMKILHKYIFNTMYKRETHTDTASTRSKPS